MSGKETGETIEARPVDRLKAELSAEQLARVEASSKPQVAAAIEKLQAENTDGRFDDVVAVLQEHVAPHDGTHDLVFVSEDDREATFACSRCNASVAFVLPGLGEPSVDGKPGDRRPPAGFMKWMDACSTS